MVIMMHYFKIDLTTGALHTAIGMATFALALLILFLLQRAIEPCKTD
jgi:hypothetical protein